MTSALSIVLAGDFGRGAAVIVSVLHRIHVFLSFSVQTLEGLIKHDFLIGSLMLSLLL